MLGHPGDCVVQRDMLVAQVLDADVPGFDGAVDQRRVGAVAERIAVTVMVLLVDQLALVLEARG